MTQADRMWQKQSPEAVPAQAGRRPSLQAGSLYQEPAQTNRLRLNWRRLGKLLSLVLLVLLTTVGVGLLSGAQPLIGALLLVAALVLPALLTYSETATLLVVFILYSNIAVVANRFHGVPYFMAASFPFLLLIPLASYLVFRRQPLIFPKALPFIFGFLGVQALGAVFARNTEVAADAVIDFIVEGLLIYLLVTNAVRTRGTLRRVTWTLLLAGVLLGGIPVIQQVTGAYSNNFGGFAQLSDTAFRTGDVTLIGEVRQFRAAGAIGEQNRYAQIMLMLVPLGLFTFWAERKWGLKLAALMATAIALLGVAMSFSRGAAIALFLLICVMALMRAIKPAHFLLFVLGVAVVLAALPQYRTRLATVTDVVEMFSPETRSADVDSSIRGRTTEMLAAVYVFADHPIIGVGPGMFKYYSQEYGNALGIRTLREAREAHSLYLDIAANNGILGLITFFGIFAVVGYQLLEVRRRWAGADPLLSRLASGYLLALLSYLMTGLFLHLSYARYLWLILALASATICVAKKQESEQEAAQLGDAGNQQPGIQSRDWLNGGHAPAESVG